MGGRLDTTNLIVPDVSVLTSISMDHRHILGDTIGAIAAEKAGIIKPGTPAVSAPQHPDVLKVIETAAAELGSPLAVVGRETSYGRRETGIDFSGMYWNMEQVPVPFPGEFQAANTAVALSALEQCAARGFALDPVKVRDGIAAARWPGRLQTVGARPDIIVDGACNVDAMQQVRKYVRTRKPDGQIVAVFGICRDKDYAEVVRVLGRVVSRFVFTGIRNPRGLTPHRLLEVADPAVPATVEPEPVPALEEAVRLAGPDGLVIVTGSLYLVGEIMHHLGTIVDHDMPPCAATGAQA
jgi:dihydrofolate synthase/folylpolyglutamate synthase